jgi:uroporphyrinogen-III synthase
MRVLITRPEPDAAGLVAALAARGHEAISAPLLEIAPLPVPPDLEARVRGCQAILLTSANGARALAGATALRSRPAYTVGQATAAVAEGHGFATVFSADGDAAALAELVRRMLRPADGPLLHASGEDRAADLGALLRPHGFVVDDVALYAARPVQRLPEAATAALGAGTVDAVLLFSPRTSRAFATLIAEAGLADRLHSIAAVAISDAALAPVARFGWRDTRVAREPNQAAVISALDASTPHAEKDPEEAGMSETAESAKKEPAAAMPQPPAEPPAASPQPVVVRRGLGVFGGLLTGAVGALAMIAVALVVAHQRPDLVRAWLPAGQTPAAPSKDEIAAIARSQADAAAGALGNRVDAAERRQGELRRGLEELQGKVVALPPATAPNEIAAVRDAQAAAMRDVQSLQALIAQLQSQAAALDNRLRQLGTQGGSAASAEEAAALKARLDKLEAEAQRLTRAVGAAADTAGHAADKEAVDREIAKLRRETEKQLTTIGETAAQLDRRLVALEGELRQRIEQLASSRGEADRRAADSARAAAAVGLAARLRQQVDTGSAFTRELELMKPLAGDARFGEILTALQPLAASGVASRAALRAEFPVMAKTALAADLTDDSIGERALGALKSLVSVRRVGADVAGDTVEAKLARAEAALEVGDVAAATALVKSFTGKPAEAAKGWLARAEAHLAAHQALDKLGMLGASLLAPAQ